MTKNNPFSLFMAVALTGLASALALVASPKLALAALGYAAFCVLFQSRVKFLLYLYLLAVFFVPLTIGIETPFLLLNVDRIVMALLLGSWTLSVLRGRLKIEPTPIDRAALIYLVVIGCSVLINLRDILHTQGFFTSLKTLFVISIERILTVYVMISVFKDKTEIRRLLWFIAACLSIVAAYGIYESAVKYNVFVHITTIKNLEVNDVALSQMMRSGLYRAKSTQVLPHIFGTELCMIFPFVFFFLMDRGSKVKAPAFLILMLLLGGVAVTYTRGVYLAFFVALVFCFLRIKQVHKKIGLVVAAVMIVSAGFAVPPVKAFYARYMTKFLNPQSMTYKSEYSIGTRLEDYSYTYKRLKHNYLLGQGYGTYRSGFKGDQYLDNAYLYVLIETGLLGLAAFLWLGYTILFGLARRLKAAAQSGETEMLKFLHIGSWVFFFQCLTYDAFVFAGASKLFWVLLGAFLVYQKFLPEKARA